jgi:hypothetical protein
MTDFYDLLRKIHQKPGIYISSPALSHLYMFLCGYAFSRQEQDLALTDQEKEFEQFQTWIQQRFNVDASISWAKIILLYSADERDGFERFFELWSEFLQEQQSEFAGDYEKVA